MYHLIILDSLSVFVFVVPWTQGGARHRGAAFSVLAKGGGVSNQKLQLTNNDQLVSTIIKSISALNVFISDLILDLYNLRHF